MTAQERAELDLLFAFVKEWRADDARWKELHGAHHERQDGRIGTLEDRFVAADAIAADAARRTLSMRAKVAIGLSAVFSLAGLIAQVAGRLV